MYINLMTCIAGAYHQYFGFLARKKVQIEGPGTRLPRANLKFRETEMNLNDMTSHSQKI